MQKDQLFFPGMEPIPKSPRPKPPRENLRAIVKRLEERVFSLEVEMTI